MRRYTPKGNVQKKAYYTDRFWVAPQMPKEKVENDAEFLADLNALKTKFEVEDAYIQAEQLVVTLKNASDNYGAVELLKNECRYNQLSELSAVDWLEQHETFEVFVQLLSMSKRKRLRIKFFISENESIGSLNPLYRSADWAEREMFDMFGIKVKNHPYFKRILMPEDWVGYPLRKSYPLHGDEAAQWYEVDRIFGKEARDVIGPEERDPAKIDRYDSTRFARLGHEVPYGFELNEKSEPEQTKISYQEEEGVFMIEKFDFEESKVIEDRKR